MNSELCMAGMLPTSTCSSDGSPRTRRLREANNILLYICTFVIRQFVRLCHLYLHIKYTYTYSEAIAKNRRRAAGKCALESIHAFSLFRVGQAESGNVSVAANAAADCAGPAYCAAQPQHQQGKPVEHWSSAGMNQLPLLLSCYKLGSLDVVENHSME